MNEDGLDRFETALETRTGEAWGRLESHLIGSRSYKEMYAFLYRESKVAYEDGAVVYMDRGDKFIREPYSARFRALVTTRSLPWPPSTFFMAKALKTELRRSKPWPTTGRGLGKSTPVPS